MRAQRETEDEALLKRTRWGARGKAHTQTLDVHPGNRRSQDGSDRLSGTRAGGHSLLRMQVLNTRDVRRRTKGAKYLINNSGKIRVNAFEQRREEK